VPKILIVDDDPEFRRNLGSVLNGAGYETVEACDGIQAGLVTERLRDELVLAVVDLALPRVNGYEVITALRRHRPGVKIIATTGVYKRTYLEVAEVVGAHVSLQKPLPGSPLPSEIWLLAVQRIMNAPNSIGAESMG
jgi:CheY-like chemotaxis protein